VRGQQVNYLNSVELDSNIECCILSLERVLVEQGDIDVFVGEKEFDRVQAVKSYGLVQWGLPTPRRPLFININSRTVEKQNK
jgi:hypothetical protein